MNDLFKDLNLQELNNIQLNRFSNHLVAMYLTGTGVNIRFNESENYLTVVIPGSKSLSIYVRSARPKNETSYSFVTKEMWNNTLDPNVIVALVIIKAHENPSIYLIPATTWLKPNSLFVDRNYIGEELKSKPEWGISTNKKNFPQLRDFEILKQLEKLKM
jgi:hypothetical protein